MNTRGNGPGRPSGISKLKPKSNLIQPKNYRLPRGDCDEEYTTSAAKAPSEQGGMQEQSPTDEAGQVSPFLVAGSRVCLAGVKLGTLRYFGKTLFADGYWCGIELDDPEGKNNGTVDGVSYFSCAANHGIFAPPAKVEAVHELPQPVQGASCALLEAFSIQNKGASEINSKTNKSSVPKVRKLSSPKVTVKRKAECVVQKLNCLQNSIVDCTYDLNNVTYESQPKVLRKGTGIPLPVSASASKESFIPEANLCNQKSVPSSSSLSDNSCRVFSEQPLMLAGTSHLTSNAGVTLSPRVEKRNSGHILNTTFVKEEEVSLGCSFREPKFNELVEETNMEDDVFNTRAVEMILNQAFDVQSESSNIEPEVNSAFINEHCEASQASGFHNLSSVKNKNCDGTHHSKDVLFIGDRNFQVPLRSHNATFIHDKQYKELTRYQNLTFNQPKDCDVLPYSHVIVHESTDNHSEAISFSPNLTFTKEKAAQITASKSNTPEIYSLPNSPEYKLCLADLELLSSTCDMRKLVEETSFTGDYTFSDALPAENCESEDLVFGYGRQGSFDLDDSLGILTPNQMKDFTIFTENSIVKTPSVEDVQELCEDTVEDSNLHHQYVVFEEASESPTESKKGIEKAVATSTPKPPQPLHGIIKEPIPFIAQNLSFYPLTEFADTPHSIKSTISEDHLRELSRINTPEDQVAQVRLLEQPLDTVNSSKSSMVKSDDAIEDVRRRMVDSANVTIDIKSEKRHNLNYSVNFSDCIDDEKDVNMSGMHLKGNPRSASGSREYNFHHIIYNKSASDVADKLLIGVMNESVKEVVATCIDPFDFNLGKIESSSNACELPAGKDHAMTEYLMQQMGQNFCDQISEKKDRPMSALTVSVTSIDTGYQGDAECDVHSATTSAINTPVEEPKKTFGIDDKDNCSYPTEGLCVLRHPKTDVGSDSDFCSDMGTSWTESELENEEKVRGRCARVIDGTLYFNDNEVQEKSVCVKDENLSDGMCVQDGLNRLSVVENVPGGHDEKSTEENMNDSSVSEESGTLIGNDLELDEGKLLNKNEKLNFGESVTSVEHGPQLNEPIEPLSAEHLFPVETLEPIAVLEHMKKIANGADTAVVTDGAKTVTEKRNDSPTAGQVLNKSGSVRKKQRDDTASKTKTPLKKEISEKSKVNPCKPEVKETSTGKGDAESDKVKISPGKANFSERPKNSLRKSDVEAPKKVKTPKKNVMSKIKAMIEATSCKVANDDETSEESKKPVRTPKKSRWEAVMSKIAAGQAEEKAKGKTIREVRSKIATTWTATKSPPLKTDDAAEKASNRYSNGSAHSYKSTHRTSRTLSEPPNGDELADDIVSTNSSNRSSHSDLSASQQSVGKIPSKSRLPRMPPAATSHKSERPCSPSQMSDISTMSAASHLSAASHVSARGIRRSATSLTSSRTLPKSRDGATNFSKVTPVSSKVRLNNTKNLSLGSSNKSLSAVSGTKRSSPLANGTTSNMKQRAASAANLNTTQNKSTVSSRPLKPPVPSRVVPPAKTLPARAQPLKEQNRIRNLKTAPSALRTGNQQPDLLNTSATSNKVEVCKEISRLETLCETRTKESSCLKTKLDHCAVGFEALTMVVKYMADELDAFSNPYLVRDVRILQAQLDKVKNDFDEAVQCKEVLEAKISDLLKAHELDVENLKAKQIQELETIQTSLTETHRKELNEERKTFADLQVALKESHQLQIEKIFAHHKSRHLEVRLRHEEEISKLAELHTKQVEGIKKEHASLMNSLKTQSASLEEDLRKQLSLLTSQCHELQQQNREFEDVILKDSDLKMQVAAGKICELHKEVDSLKTVVELRNKEIHDLRSSNNKLQKLEEELHLSQEKVSLLTSRMEDLQAQVDIKNKHGRKLTTEHQVLKEWYERESKASKRLSMEKEELQWKLQQTIESSPLHAGSAPDFALMKSYSELDTIFTPVRTCSGDCSPEQASKSNRIQTLLSSPIYSKLPAAKLGSPVMSRSSNVRQRRHRFSISDNDPTLDTSSLAGVRYRRAASMSWTVGLDHGDAPDCLLSRLSLNCDQVISQESEHSVGSVDCGSGDHTPEHLASENSAEVLLIQGKQVMEKQLCPSLDEQLQLAVNERLKSTEDKEVCEEVDKHNKQQISPKSIEQPNDERRHNEIDAIFCSKLQSDSKENLRSLESPLSETSENSEVSDRISLSSENKNRHKKLERRLSNADARVPSLITVQQLDDQVGSGNKSRLTSAKRDRRDNTNLRRISVTKCSSPKSNIRQEKNVSKQDVTETELVGNVSIVGNPTSISKISRAIQEAQGGHEISSIEKNPDYESFETEINKGNCTIIDATEASGSAHWEANSAIHDLQSISIDTPSGVSVTKNSGAPYISVDRSPCTFEEVNRENADLSQPELLCSSVDTIELDCSSHSNISISPQPSLISYMPADNSGLERKDAELLFDGLQNIFSCDWGNDIEDKISRKSENSIVNSESGSSPSKSSLVITFKPQKLAGSSCDSSPPPEPLEMLQVSESSTSHSEESSPLPSPTFRSRPEEVTENLSCSYTMSPRTSAGEAMVLVDLSTTLRQEPSRDTSGLLLRRTFHDQYLTDSISSCNASLRVSAEAYGKDSSSEEMSQQCNSKPATPESCSQAVAPTDSTNIDLSWSDDDEDDIPSESEV